MKTERISKEDRSMFLPDSSLRSRMTITFGRLFDKLRVTISFGRLFFSQLKLTFTRMTISPSLSSLRS